MNEANESTGGPTCGRKPHIPLRQGRERAEHPSGGQGTEFRALRSAGVGDCSVKQIELEETVPSSGFGEELRDFHAMLVAAEHRSCQRGRGFVVKQH